MKASKLGEVKMRVFQRGLGAYGKKGGHEMMKIVTRETEGGLVCSRRWYGALKYTKRKSGRHILGVGSSTGLMV